MRAGGAAVLILALAPALVTTGCDRGTTEATPAAGSDPAATDLAAARRFDRLYNRGLLFFHIDDFDRAETAFRAAVTLRSTDPKPHYYLGRILLERKRYRPAEAALGEALRRDPSFAAADLLLAEVYFRSNRPDEGERHIEALRARRPDEAGVYYYLGWMRERQNRVAEAGEAYTELLRRDPDHLEGRFRLGLVEMKRQQWEAARRTFAAVLRLDPDHFGALFNLAKVLGRLDAAVEREAALARYQELITRTEQQIYRNTRIASHLKAGIEHLNAERFDAAEKEFAAAVSLNPELPRGHYYLGLVQLQAGRPQEALVALQRAADLDPADERIQMEIGRALALAGDLSGAIAALREAIRLNPFFDMPHYYLVGIFQAARDPDGARRHQAEFQRLRSLAAGEAG